MTANLAKHAVEASEDAVKKSLRGDGLAARSWDDKPGALYSWHSHDYKKVLYCVEGRITFHTHDGDIEMEPGDRLDLEPATEHAATVGPDGVTCFEAWVLD
ncbi:MAG: cupin domain-containing protein [Actinomycetota bacterium]|nr:cupin domain-containing protein [Actinomycetota bacterium]